MAAAYDTIETGSTELRHFPVVTRAGGAPISGGTVNWYLKALTGTNAGKWWRTSDGTWQNSETANAMTHQADGHWTRDPVGSSRSPFADGTEFLEYAKESGDLHIPVARKIKAGYTPSADTANRVDLGKWKGTAPASLVDTDKVPASVQHVGSVTVQLATTQPNYAPAKAGDAMALTSGERTTFAGVLWGVATSGLTGVGSIGKYVVDYLANTYNRLGALQGRASQTTSPRPTRA